MARLMATFRPQAWINDYAVDIDGAVDFDATEVFLSHDLDWIRSFRGNDYCSDSLAQDMGIVEGHDGPFEVDADVDDWLDELGFPPHDLLTEDQLTELRKMFGLIGRSAPC